MLHYCIVIQHRSFSAAMIMLKSTGINYGFPYNFSYLPVHVEMSTQQRVKSTFKDFYTIALKIVFLQLFCMRGALKWNQINRLKNTAYGLLEKRDIANFCKSVKNKR